jgi:cell fate (sporulation/competence/biofilm development) regulator YlbF (YheA/YmcA/DUF963 family)
MSREDILAQAGRLGKMIADSPEAGKLKEAQKALEAEPELKQLLQDTQQHMDKMSQLESSGQPIEVDDKRRLQELQNQLIASETFKQFTAAQVEYVDLMRKVNEAMRSELREVEERP